MKVKFTVDKEGVLNERTKELERSNNYVQLKITYEPLPDDVLERLAMDTKAFSQEGNIHFGELMEKVEDYMEEHTKHLPLFDLSGENISPLDKMILLAIASEVAQTQVIETYREIKNNEEEN